VANPRKVRLIYKNRRKNDAIDAMYWRGWRAPTRALGSDPPSRAGGPEEPGDASRSRCVGEVAGAADQPCQGSGQGDRQAPPAVGFGSICAQGDWSAATELVTALGPVIEVIASLTAQIRTCERALEVLAEAYPETCCCARSRGSGRSPRLPSSSRWRIQPGLPRAVPLAHTWSGPSATGFGRVQAQLRISKEGDAFLRRLLVGSAQYILGSFGEDCDCDVTV